MARIRRVKRRRALGNNDVLIKTRCNTNCVDLDFQTNPVRDDETQFLLLITFFSFFVS